jgi:Meiotically up-regulated gene 113
MPIDKELEELFNDPLLDDIGQEDLSLFDVPENFKRTDNDKPDYVARRVLCANFSDYEEGFKKVQLELKTGKRSIIKFNANALKAGNYYVIGGVILRLEYVDDLVEKTKRKKKDARTRCIYENGTESDIFLDTLRRSLTSEGYFVTESTDTNDTVFDTKFDLTVDDIQDGWIYVLRSLSQNSQICEQKDLYKIGFSTTPVEKRIVNAANDTTYLMDKVEIVATWKTFNMNTQKFEALIHSFFSAVQFRMQLVDASGARFTALEWYVVPLGIIENVINRIIDGSIIHYRYNPALSSLEQLPEKEQDNSKEKYDTNGLKVLTLIIKQAWLDEILAERKTIEYRQLKQTQLGKYTWVSNEDGKRYLTKYDLIRFYVGYNKDRQTALVQITDTTYDGENQLVEYHLGKILEK